MQKYSRSQEKKKLLFELELLNQKIQESHLDFYNFEQFRPYKGCYCSECVAGRKEEQSIRSHIGNLNKPTLQNFGELLLKILLQ
jgi:hypothetical protein